MSTLALTQRLLFKPQRREEKIAVCSGSMPLPPEDRAEILAILAYDEESDISERAQNALLSQPVESFLKALERADSDAALFRYSAENLRGKPGIADALARNAGCPAKLVTRVVPNLTSAGIQGLLDNLEQFCEDQALIEAVLRSTAPTAEQRALLDELTKGVLTSAEIENAAADVEPNMAQRETLMQRLAHMNVVQRLMLALKGGRTERMALIRDPNKLVQRSVLQSPRLTDSEVEGFRLDEQSFRRGVARNFEHADFHEELHGGQESREQSQDPTRCVAPSVPTAERDRPGEINHEQERSRNAALLGRETSPQAQDGRELAFGFFFSPRAVAAGCFHHLTNGFTGGITNSCVIWSEPA